MPLRREFLGALAGGAAACAVARRGAAVDERARRAWADLVRKSENGEDVVAFLRRHARGFDRRLYGYVLGSANEFKEGDQLVGVAAADDDVRRRARALLANTRLADLDARPVLADSLHRFTLTALDRQVQRRLGRWTLGQLKTKLLESDEATIRTWMPGLSSHVIGCLVKLMTNGELITLGVKIFNVLPGSHIGAKGYLGARVQPNSPTDNLDDIRWQVFDAWSYAVGDVLLGTNPVSSEPQSVAAIERALQDLIQVFGLQDVLPHCVLAHIDVQSKVESLAPGSTALWFQSIAGTDTANATFGISVEKMAEYARSRTGRYGLYFETGQGADFTNGHSHGFDMVLHESRKYGFARALTRVMDEALRRDGGRYRPWVHLNDVAGFIGPEVFRTREQLVRCCLEDIVMGKLHGLCLGLDVCTTLHMDVSLDDLDWCLDQIMPANPAYLMALPTKIDPMLGYLTTGFQDHVRLRSRFGFRVDDRMESFFRQLGVIDDKGRPTQYFGDPLWVFVQYQRRKGDGRRESEIRADGEAQLEEVRKRGVFIAWGHGKQPWDLAPSLASDIRRIYDDAKKSIWSTLSPEFVAAVPEVRALHTTSRDRAQYIAHPETGERLRVDSQDVLRSLRRRHAGAYDVQIVISDGLNALAISDPGHLEPFLRRVRKRLTEAGFRVAPEHLVVTSGRVRAGYRIGEALFGGLSGDRSVLHIIGERPGTGHHTFSIYITRADGRVWGEAGKVDHDITKVVSGVAVTALPPVHAADDTVRVLLSIRS